MQRDQFVLAMEVSTKCQLDTSPVWSAWGMACLRCGDLAKARDRFKHRFQVDPCVFVCVCECVCVCVCVCVSE